MFVVTADQRDSRHDIDRVDAILAELGDLFGDRLPLPPDRTAGDEVQLLTAEASTALAVVLHLHRSRRWSIGLGVGAVDSPLPTATRAASGRAFFVARDAVEAAKRRPNRVVIGSPSADAGAAFPSERDADALLLPYLALLDQRTDAGWQVADLLASGATQAEAADRLGVSPQAVSLRVKAANAKADEAVSVAVVRLLDTIDRALAEA